jgi:hypothetical protein
MASNKSTCTPAPDKTSADIKPDGPAPTTTTFFIMTLVFFNNAPLEPLQRLENAADRTQARISNSPGRATRFRFLSQFHHCTHFKLSI